MKKSTTENSDNQSFSILAEGSMSGKENRSLEVIQNQEQLNTAFSIINKNSTQSQSKDVDFTKQTVLALFAGQKNTGGHSIGVSAVEKKGDTTYVTVEETGPKQGEMATMVITYPYIFVIIDKTEKVIFN